jgi:hypothetical protein
MRVWRARAVSLAVLRGAAALAGFGFVYANLLGVVSTVETVVLPRRVGGLEIAERVPAASLRWVSAAAAAVLGILLALPLDGWTAVDALLTARTFREIEPYTGRDLGFFVHWLPLENALYAWALVTLVVTAALVLALYSLTPGLRWSRGRPRLSGRVRRHLTVFGVGVLLLLAWGHRLDAYALLSAGSGESGMFSAADQVGAMPARFALAAMTALASLVVLRAGWTGQPRVAFWAVTVVVAGALLVRTLAPAVTARLASPAVLAGADTAALANRALYTQRAYGVDRIRAAPPGYGLDAAAIAGGAVSAWDAPALARAAYAARRTEGDGEVGFQSTASGLVAVLVERALAARAAGDARSADDADHTVLLLDAVRADAAGRPLPSADGPLADAGRRVRLIVRPGAAGSLTVAGAPGVIGDGLDDWRVRMAHALAGRDLRFAFSGSDAETARLVDRRDVRARVEALAAFFAQGRSVTPVLALDSVWYAVSLYSASAHYPLAQHYTVDGDEWASFRHAATALVNAQSGAVRLVPAPELDADAGAWVRRFPDLFTPSAALSGELARAIPPATDGALVQAYAFAQFGARGDRAAVARRVPPPDGGDTALAGPGRAALALRPLGVAAGGEAVVGPAIGGATAPVLGWTLPSSRRPTGLRAWSSRPAGPLLARSGRQPQPDPPAGRSCSTHSRRPTHRNSTGRACRRHPGPALPRGRPGRPRSLTRHTGRRRAGVRPPGVPTRRRRRAGPGAGDGPGGRPHARRTDGGRRPRHGRGRAARGGRAALARRPRRARTWAVPGVARGAAARRLGRGRSGARGARRPARGAGRRAPGPLRHATLGLLVETRRAYVAGLPGAARRSQPPAGPHVRRPPAAPAAPHEPATAVRARAAAHTLRRSE